ncbi:restriction endonuclease subunit S [Shewanella sp. KX20019]|uniref:restriction endonuclease subunit S n=1 Tax=Shewanella sp. KX20019 TaxID=2803864 RepID=UPI001925665A|nr:restriction endonuclease subunit S [Shewanella sp. KX20019]QQX80003.1 restriction endonuclease subunit S [Shewanella sp. KX20019]
MSQLASNQVIPDGYQQTDVGVIPVDWQCLSIGELRPFVTSGSRGWATFYSAHGDPFVRITNMSRESVDLDMTNTKFVLLPEQSSEGKRTSLENGDILISITADIGICSYINEKLAKPAFINQHIALVRFDKLEVNSQFVAHFLSSENVQKLFKGSADQGAKAGMNLEAIRKIRTAIPSIEEQTAIANALSDVDALLSELEKHIAKKQAIKTATMQQLLTGKTRLPAFGYHQESADSEGELEDTVKGQLKGTKSSELGGIPEDWEVKLLDELSIISRLAGAEYTSMWKEDPKGGIIALRGFNIGKNTLINRDLTRITDSLSKKLKRSKLTKGDVIYPCVGSIGNAAVIYEDNKYHIQQNIARISPISSKLHPEYLCYYLMSEMALKEVERFTATTSQPSVLVSSLRKYRIPFPKLKEQTAIAAILSDMDEELQALSQRLSKTRQIKQGMMQELLTGRTRLPFDKQAVQVGEA